ncbi:uncharacterized protein HMPREF1541_10449 [Cyphellophora europaea CBS 101466]|uniref:Methyltransferase domain-containing protein n=1 Tax=Cyphellophora europaea (strain CBS 101466) TaxID=1220924 RepID=W2S8K9_CYPE1|nr:uncharacterized protein HMPREF1541_10449 [Cyphellophora europaea CBS 101466]ETN44269.1 hypothetical protein HMPREF1541_10449 [Cyphellophora europaea CBS 101466]
MNPNEEQNNQPIAVDEAHDQDSAIGEEDTQTRYTSLKSNIFNYRYENGRRYHAFRAGSYWGPNDEKAMDQLDIGHHVFKILLGGQLHLAPIDINAGRVLDVGTGTGIWAIEFADMNPDSSVIGTDLSPIQPTWVPPNCEFEVNDCTGEWGFQEESFDFIHIRGLYGSVADWDAFYQEVYKHLKPGAYVQQVEQSVEPKSDDRTTDGTVFERWGKLSLECGDKFGKTLRVVDESAGYMKKAGLEDVTEKRFKIPIGPWAKDKRMKELGIYNRLQCEEGIEGWSMMLLTTVLGWDRAEVEVYLVEMRRALADKSIHAYQEW